MDLNHLNIINVLIGIFSLFIGLASLFLRLSGRSGKLKKLEPMKQFMGNTVGNIVHLIAYTIVPLSLGIGLLFVEFFITGP